MNEDLGHIRLLDGGKVAFDSESAAALLDRHNRIYPGTARSAESWGPVASPGQVERADGFYARFGKRIFDILAAGAFMLTLGFWLLPLIGLLIKLDSRGPVFFRQGRVGKNGVVFPCVKFRTMYHDPQARFVQAQKDDPRVTRVGRVLRRTNLDELPQFLNVLKGQMSVIGPRPHVPELDAAFGDRVPGYLHRTVVAPGVSGLAQVSGCRGETCSVRNMTHRVRFDLFYAKNMSLRMDIKIIFQTIWLALRGDERAY